VSSSRAFSLTSTAFKAGGEIPRKFTCDGENVSPELTWRGAPGDTAAFALILDDPDARDFAHWLVYNMTGSASGALPEAVSASPDAPPQGINDFGKIGYGGPCPPSGSHHYRFTLYALDAMLDIAAAPRVAGLKSALEGHVIEATTLTATYRRR
jgi:Raf kinase inhibitor-like YbhB/YbcL family protein